MESAGLHELRQRAASLLRRVQAGEEFTITDSRRDKARLVPVAPARWRSWSDVAAVFEGPSDDEWAADRELLDGDTRML